MVEAARQTTRAVALRTWLWSRREALVFGAIGLLAFAVTVYFCAPGFMSRDSGTHLEQARAFEFWDDHPILMALIWHFTDRILPGPLGMLVLMNGLCWTGLSVLFWALPGPLSWRALGLLGVGFFPPAFSTLPVIMKDALLQGALLAGCACLVVPSHRARGVRLLLAVMFFLIAIGVRHNAAAAAWPLLTLPLLRLRVWVAKPRWLRLVSASGVALALTFGMTLGLDRALSPITHKTEFWQTVPTFDLAGMSLKTGEVLVEPESRVLSDGMGLEEIRSLFRVEYGSMLYYCIAFGGQRCVPVFRLTLDHRELRLLSENWLRAILAHPGAYLAHRIEFAKALLAISARPKELYFVNAAPHHLLAKDYPPTERSLRVLAWLEQHIRSVIWYRPWVYLALSCVVLPVALVRHLRGGSVLPVLFTLSGAAYLLSVIVGATSSDFRYTVWSTLASVLGLITLVASFAAGRPKLAATSRA